MKAWRWTHEDFPFVLWGVPAVAGVHLLDEMLELVPRASLGVIAIGPDLSALLPPLSTAAYLGVVGLVFAAALGLALAGGPGRRAWAVPCLLAVQAALAFNIFLHVAMALSKANYVVGLASALAVSLPYSVYLFSRVYTEAWLSRRGLILLPFAGLLLHGPVLLAVVWLMARLLPA
jgi:hypothetical protein